MPKIFSGKRDVYLEIAERYENFIRLGVLKNGDKLPSVRTAAEELSVNPNTVQKAYTHLERQGLICSLPKKGAFVTYSEVRNTDKTRHHAEIVRALQALKDIGVDQNEVISVMKEVFEDD